MKKINIKDLKSGPLQREELPPKLEKWANSIHKFLGDDLIGPYERFEAGFCRDQNPIRELFVWQTIASTLQAWEEKIDCDRAEIFKQLLSFSISGEAVKSTKISLEDILSLKQLMIKIKKELLQEMIT